MSRLILGGKLLPELGSTGYKLPTLWAWSKLEWRSKFLFTYANVFRNYRHQRVPFPSVPVLISETEEQMILLFPSIKKERGIGLEYDIH